VRKFKEFLAEMDGGGTGAGACAGGTMSGNVAVYPTRLFGAGPVQRGWVEPVATGYTGTIKRRKRRK
jgi:hypothetical protein